MKKKERIAQLEAEVQSLRNRIIMLEARPVYPLTTAPRPWQPWYQVPPILCQENIHTGTEFPERTWIMCNGNA